MTDARWVSHRDQAELATAMTESMRLIIDRAVQARGQACLVLPGGQSPLPIFQRLSAALPDWRRVTIIPTDDRLVPPHDPLSNAAALMRCFAPRGARVISLADDALDYKQAGKAADDRLQKLAWPPDVAWLGMGADGHTASIFHGPDLKEALTTSARALGVRPDPLPKEAPVPRVSLSLAALTATPELIMAISGEAKRAVLERALADGASSTLPIGRVLAAAPGPVTLHWSP